MYKSLVRRLVEHGTSIWDLYTSDNAHKIKMVQRRAARFVLNDYRQSSSVSQMLNQLQWQTLSERRAHAKCILMFRIVNHLVEIPPCMLTSTINVRGHSTCYLVPYARTCVYRHSFFPDAICLWNGLPQQTVDSPSLNAFCERMVQSTSLRR